jgi:orotidine-5'-phosphate decarboxylase
MDNLWPRLVVALDLDCKDRIKNIINKLSPKVSKFKIGPIAFVRFGPAVIDWAKEKGADIFLDLKFYDIPNTMIEAAKALVDLGVWSFTIHLKAGKESISLLSSKITEYAKKQNKRKPLIFGVTELTSNQASLKDVVGLARTGKDSGIDGIVSSVWEAKKIKDETGLLTVTPGIRPKKTTDDQKRTATLRDAVSAGVDYFVVGRPIVKDNDPYLAAKNLIESAA